MSLAKTRTRLVSFRLSEEELENLRVACLMQGARNVSEFARSAVLNLSDAQVHPQAQPGMQLLDRFSSVELRLHEIETSQQHHGDMLRAVLKGLVNRGSERERRVAPPNGEEPSRESTEGASPDGAPEHPMEQFKKGI